MERQFYDQMGNCVTLNRTPERVVSLVPSQTELLYYLGTPPIGQTIFCIHPGQAFSEATKIGGTKKLNLDKIRALKPDLIIGNTEENERSQIEALSAEFPVWMSDINTIQDGLDMITRVGALLGKSNESIQLKLGIQSAFNRLIATKGRMQRVLYLIWRDPYFGVGSQTFVHDVLQHWGVENVLANQPRYPELSREDMIDLNPDVVLLSSEPFPFKEKHRNEILDFLPNATTILVDGELFSWYGNRMLDTPGYLEELTRRYFTS